MAKTNSVHVDLYRLPVVAPGKSNIHTIVGWGKTAWWQLQSTVLFLASYNVI